MSPNAFPSETSGRDWIDRATLVAIFTAVAALSLHKIIALDFWWQLTTGGWILENGFPRIDPFSYGLPDRDWSELRWRYYVLCFQVAEAFGLNGLILAKCAVILTAFGVLAVAFRAREGWITSAGLLMVAVLIYPRLRLRPEVMSFVWLATTLLCLDRYRRNGPIAWLVALPVVQILWANTHTLWVLGPVLIWTAVICETLQKLLSTRFVWLAGEGHAIEGIRLRRLTVAAIAVSSCGLATPYFLEGALYPITLWQQIRAGSELSLLIHELRSPLLDARYNFHYIAYLTVMWLSAASFLLRPDRFVLTRLAWWAGFLLLSLLSVRNLSLFGFIAAAVTVAHLRDWTEEPQSTPPDGLRRWIPRAARSTAALLSISLTAAVVTDAFWVEQNYPHRFGFGVEESRFPVRAMAYVKEQGIPTPVLSNLGEGGYILYAEGERSVYVDGRLEVYGQEVLARVLPELADAERFRAIADEYEIDTAVLSVSWAHDAINGLEQRPDWVAVYFDPSYIVYVRLNAQTRPLLERLAIRWDRPERKSSRPPAFVTPPDWLEGFVPRVADVDPFDRLGRLYIMMGALPAARDSFAEASRIRPDLKRLWLHLGLLQEVLGEPESAAASLAHVDSGTLEREKIAEVRSGLRIKRTAGCRAAAARPGDYNDAPDRSFDLGACYEWLGDAARARTVFEALLAVSPAHAKASAGLARLATVSP